MQIRTMQNGFEVLGKGFEPFERDLNHSKGIQSIRMQIRTIQNGFEAFEMQIRTSRKGFKAFECKFEPFERDLMLSNPNSNHSKGI